MNVPNEIADLTPTAELNHSKRLHLCKTPLPYLHPSKLLPIGLSFHASLFQPPHSPFPFLPLLYWSLSTSFLPAVFPLFVFFFSHFFSSFFSPYHPPQPPLSTSFSSYPILHIYMTIAPIHSLLCFFLPVYNIAIHYPSTNSHTSYSFFFFYPHMITLQYWIYMKAQTLGTIGRCYQMFLLLIVSYELFLIKKNGQISNINCHEIFFIQKLMIIMLWQSHKFLFHFWVGFMF